MRNCGPLATTARLQANRTDLAGNVLETSWSFSTGSNAEDTQPPLPPTGLTCTLNDLCRYYLEEYNHGETVG